MQSSVITWLPLAAGTFAASLATWIAIKGRGSGRPPGCAPGSACDALAATKWSRWINLPVAGVAALVFATYVNVAELVAFHPRPMFQTIEQSIALMVAGAAVWFAFLQAAIVGLRLIADKVSATIIVS